MKSFPFASFRFAPAMTAPYKLLLVVSYMHYIALSRDISKKCAIYFLNCESSHELGCMVDWLRNRWDEPSVPVASPSRRGCSRDRGVRTRSASAFRYLLG